MVKRFFYCVVPTKRTGNLITNARSGSSQILKLRPQQAGRSFHH